MLPWLCPAECRQLLIAVGIDNAVDRLWGDIEMRRQGFYGCEDVLLHKKQNLLLTLIHTESRFTRGELFF